MGNIERISVEEKLESSFLEYSVSVIAGRTVPDVRDGLKPVHRRIVYSLFGLDALHDGHLRKSARIVGDVIGKYHPHGDSSVYDAMVRMAQDFSMMIPLVCGQGNFGSLDGDPPAAMRYTEAKGTRFLSEIMANINKDVVDFIPNYDGSLTEPSVLPSLVPNLLINGTSGIAVGMTTSIPPHNPTEILTACLSVLNDPKIDVTSLLKIVKGPDFPTGGIAYLDKGFQEIYEKGCGSFKICAEIETEENCVIIRSIPYNVKKNDIIEKISALINTNKIIGISRVVDESNSKNGVKIRIECSKKIDTDKIKNILIKNTALETTFSCNFLAIKNKQPKIYNLKSLIEEYLEYQHILIRRLSNYELHHLKIKKERLDALIKVLGNVDKAIKLIRNSDDANAATSELVNHFRLSLSQARYILEIKLQRLVKTEVKRVEDELSTTESMISNHEELLSDARLQKKEISKNLKRLLKEYGAERKTSIFTEDVNADVKKISSTVQDLPTVICMNQDGLIKRGATFSSIKGNNDSYITKIECSTHSLIGCISDRGTFFTLEAYKIPEGNKNSPAHSFAKFFKMKDEKVVNIFLVSTENSFIYIFTKNGYLKKSHISNYKKTGPSGVKGINLDESDSVICVESGNEGEIIVCSSGGNVFRYADDLTPVGRASKGVQALKLRKNEYVIAASAINTGEKAIVCLDEDRVVSSIEVSSLSVKNKLTRVYRVENAKSVNIVDKENEFILICETNSISMSVNALSDQPVEMKNFIKIAQYV